MHPHTIIFIGPQGSGKGTQIELLREALKQKDPTRVIVDIQTGRRFRALAARGEGFTESHLSDTLDTGVLQPLFLSVVLWGDAMREKLDDVSHLLIDGFPRTVPEAVVLESAFKFYERSSVTVINLETPEDIVRSRMEGRARKDDTPASIGERLRWYREETVPVIEYYRSREHTSVIDIDGTQGIEEVHAAIGNALGLV
ncbi:nucleoside monophosphate kinase [Candidatus Kaiserbacteria bacterium]|nr:nucleoside monophosphate kinase [Candidatus Kaiserbacteria bacterium]